MENQKKGRTGISGLKMDNSSMSNIIISKTNSDSKDVGIFDIEMKESALSNLKIQYESSSHKNQIMSNKICYIVKTWNNGDRNSSGAGYGIRIDIKDFDNLKDWKEIIVGKESIKRTTKNFTKKCPEIRSIIIGKFLFKNNLSNWQYRKPFKLKVYKIEEQKFELTPLNN